MKHPAFPIYVLSRFTFALGIIVVSGQNTRWKIEERVEIHDEIIG